MAWLVIPMLVGFHAYSAIHPKCLPGSSAETTRVTHYMLPLLNSYDAFTCEKMEGSCIFKKKGSTYLHSVGYGNQLLANARCKNGYGNKGNCLHPCRTIAASMKHHRFGQIVFLPSLVGLKCGNKVRDGFEFAHDGYVIVGDTGSPKHFNMKGRFDFFWGRCAKRSQGRCLEGADIISQELNKSDYCVVWDPKAPLKNQDIRMEFVSTVQEEAIERGDPGAADDF